MHTRQVNDFLCDLRARVELVCGRIDAVGSGNDGLSVKSCANLAEFSRSQRQATRTQRVLEAYDQATTTRGVTVVE
jgi:hypothetical protein